MLHRLRLRVRDSIQDRFGKPFARLLVLFSQHAYGVHRHSAVLPQPASGKIRNRQYMIKKRPTGQSRSVIFCIGQGGIAFRSRTSCALPAGHFVFLPAPSLAPYPPIRSAEYSVQFPFPRKIKKTDRPMPIGLFLYRAGGN